jgi:ABC-type bacteriocin/lantibiotic exporter with double-glycine peptidase domain
MRLKAFGLLFACGPVALARTARVFGVRLPLMRLVSECGTDRFGTTLLALKRAAERNGFAVGLFRANYAALKEFQTPLIVHMRIGHYEVVEACDSGGVSLAGRRRQYLTRENFEERWSKVVMTLRPAA